MIIDRILDRYDGDAYDPKEFYDDMMSYEEGTDYKISRAMDSGEEEDIRRELCAYIDDAQYNPKIKDFINSVAWLEPDNGKKYKAVIDILGESKKSEADYGAMTWTVTVEFDDNGKSVRKDYVVKAHNRDSAIDQAKLKPRHTNPDAKDIKVTYCKLGECLAKKHTCSMQKKKESLAKKNEAYSDYDAIRDWLEGVMEKAGTMFESAYVSENRPGEICAEIEGYDSTGGDAIISLVWNAGEDFAETISAMADELVEYAEDFDPEEEAKMYSNSGLAGVPSLRQLLKAMDERKEDMVSLAGAVSLAASKL